MKKMFVVLGIVILILGASYIRNVNGVKLTQEKLDKEIQNIVDIGQFDIKYRSFFILVKPETRDKNSFLLNLSLTDRPKGIVINQIIDLDGYYDYIVQDRNNIYKANIIDSNKVFKTLSFECESYEEYESKLYFSDYVEISDDEIKNTEIKEIKSKNEKVEYYFLDTFLLRDGSEIARGVTLDFIPNFVIDGVKYNTVDYVYPYCTALKP